MRIIMIVIVTITTQKLGMQLRGRQKKMNRWRLVSKVPSDNLYGGSFLTNGKEEDPNDTKEALDIFSKTLPLFGKTIGTI